MGKCVGVWGDVRRSIKGGVEKCAEVWGDVGKCWRRWGKVLGVGVRGVGSGKLGLGGWG